MRSRASILVLTSTTTTPKAARVMRCARKNSRRSRAESAFRQWHLGLTLLLLFLAAGIPEMPAAAQESSPAPAASAGGTQAAPTLRGPDVLPPPPGGGFGFPNPLVPPNVVNNAIAPAPAVPTEPLGLAPLGIGVVPLQQGDPTAPAYLLRPTLTVGATLADNLRYLHSPRI